jgi:phosphatidylinositol glycan class N
VDCSQTVQNRNVASISSFYLEPVYRLIPVFDPFSMASLLMLKIMIPFLIVSAVFASLTSQLRLPPFALFFVAVTMSDVLAINFFFLVTDKGSWLEIGRTSGWQFLLLYLWAYHLFGWLTRAMC